MVRASLFAILVLFQVCSFGQAKVEPPFWWTGMKNTKLQIMVHMPLVAKAKVKVVGDNVKLLQTTPGESKNYCFIDLDLSNAPAQTFSIQLSSSNLDTIISYELKPRTGGPLMDGINSSDLIYLITPDRFENGDASNDNVAGFSDGLNREDDYGRHGGDLAGIKNRLGDIRELGFTSIWLNPVLENNTLMSYHGYSTTDYYNVDRRFGTNSQYRDVVRKAHANGMKVIMDQIVNHCSHKHWWMSDFPFPDWINNGGEYINTNHRRTLTIDPNGSEEELRLFKDGWFVETMPDLNQRNPFMAKYLIQNSIWWIEYSGISGIRQDTYPYADESFLTNWSCAIMDEYPNFFIVGEEWSVNPLITSYWQRGSKIGSPGSCLPSVMDFPIQAALVEAISENEDWNKGWIKLFEALGNDYIYGSPNDLVIFADNHDMNRFYTQVDNDLSVFKMGMTLVYTLRGIPQVYYGTEVLLSNSKDGDHGEIREEMPGGWADHDANAWKGEGLSQDQKEAQAFLTKLGDLRKNSTALQTGSFQHYLPVDGVYVYKRSGIDHDMLIVLNKSDDCFQLDWKKYGYDISGKLGITPKLSSELQMRNDVVCVKGKSSEIFEIR